MLQAHRLRQVLVVELERRRLRRVQDLEVVGEHLDLAGHEVRIGAALGAQAHEPRHADHELVAQRFGGGERRGAVGIEDDLHEAFAVAQVDEDDAAVVAAAMDPAHQRDRLAEVAGGRCVRSSQCASMHSPASVAVQFGDGSGGRRGSAAAPACATARPPRRGQFRGLRGGRRRSGRARPLPGDGGAAQRRPSR